MQKRIVDVTPPAAPQPSSAHSWFERLILRILGLPTPEQVEERLRNYRGFFARMTPEQRAALDNWDGPDPDVLGSPKGPKRKF
jgi:hypothetical protein